MELPRKYKAPISSRIDANIILHSNERPSFFDSSGAIASRFIWVHFARSFVGQEDPHLKSAALAQIPQFILWALGGYKRLSERGYFIQPESGKNLAAEFADSVSDVGRFISTHYDITGDKSDIETTDSVYRAFIAWSQAEQMPQKSRQTFGRELSAFAGNQIEKKRNVPINGARVDVYTGLRRQQ